MSATPAIVLNTGEPPVDVIDPDEHIGDTEGDAAPLVEDLLPAVPILVKFDEPKGGQLVNERRPNGWNAHRVAVGTTATLVLGANPARRSFTLVNRNATAGDAVSVDIAAGQGSCVVGAGVELRENDEHSGDHTGEVWAIASEAGAVIHVAATYDNPAADRD